MEQIIKSFVDAEDSSKNIEGVSLEDILKKFEEKCDVLSKKYKANISFEYFLERIGNKKSGEPTGKVFVAYVRQPHILAAAKCMDMLLAGNVYQAGGIMWDAMVCQETDSELSAVDLYRLGLQGRLGMLLEVQSPEDKKK